MTNEELIAAARKGAENTYSPFSNFPVGAALLAKNGKVYYGCNIENSSYGMTVCAERVAIFTAVAAGVREFEAIAVTCLKGNPDQPESLMPCGACRQVMAEFLSPETRVVVEGVGEFKLEEIFPKPFKLPAL